MTHMFKSYLLAALLLVGCGQEGIFDSDKTGTLKIRLTDAPGDFEKVNITFSEVSVLYNSTWIDVRNKPISVDLLEWSSGRSMVLSEAPLPAGGYTRVRVKIDNASLVIAGQTLPLSVPSSLKNTGVTRNAAFNVTAGSTFELVIDFDTRRSIINTGANQYQLQPALRVTSLDITGSFTGTITNPTHAPTAYAIANGDTITTTLVPQIDGAFRLAFLPEGTYTVLIRDTLGRSYTSPQMGLIPRADSDLGAITLE